MDLIDDIFIPVFYRIKNRADSLLAVRRFKRSGIESWLKVESAAALSDQIVKFQNRGPDLLLVNDIQIELKGATDLNPSWIINGVTKYDCPCLFIGDGQEHLINRLMSDKRAKLLIYKTISDGINPWIIGLMIPNKFSYKKNTNRP